MVALKILIYVFYVEKYFVVQKTAFTAFMVPYVLITRCRKLLWNVNAICEKVDAMDSQPVNGLPQVTPCFRPPI